VEMTGNSPFPPIGRLPYMLTLPPYGFFWFTLEDASQAPAWHPNPPELMPEYLTFVIRRELNEILEGKSREALEREVLPTYLPMRRWFAAKDERLVRVEIVEWLEMPDTLRPILLLELEATTATDERTRTERYLMPVGYLFESDIISAMPEQLSFARVRRFDKVGYLTDAFTFDTLAHTVVRLMRRNHRHETRAGVLAFRPTHALETVSIDDRAEIRRPAAEQTNSSLIIGEQAMLKLFRRITAGIHPEVEIGRVLTERGFANTPPLLGDITRIAPDGTEYVLGVVQGFIHNQGDAWSWTLDLLQRAILAGADEQGPQSVDSIFSELQHFVERLGTRLGELHVVLAQPADDPAFHPEAVSPAQVALWRESVSAQWHEALRLAEDITDPALMPLVEALQQCRTQFDAVIAQLAAGALGGLTIRTHGDLHLGQVLVVQDDAYIIDFEGEPARSLEERRRKTSPLRDVAGVLRSFDYAAHMARTSVTVDEVATEWREAIVTRFESMVHLVFVAAYKDATLQLCENWATQSDWDSLIDLFLIEKAAYEIAYEKSHRPDWVNVPLRGLSALAERLCQTPSGEHEL
ncbi:MAG: putative maltokinase, partial [Spongiibacteraceae bacterium]|nr:putative maltokinase [Spongiibacteraceae bacterium]